MYKAHFASGPPPRKREHYDPSLFRDRLQEIDRDFALQTKRLTMLYKRLSGRVSNSRKPNRPPSK